MAALGGWRCGLSSVFHDEEPENVGHLIKSFDLRPSTHFKIIFNDSGVFIRCARNLPRGYQSNTKCVRWFPVNGGHIKISVPMWDRFQSDSRCDQCLASYGKDNHVFKYKSSLRFEIYTFIESPEIDLYYYDRNGNRCIPKKKILDDDLLFVS
jgi:hypothetical protein